MLRISKLTDYAIVVLSFLALDPQRIASATQIAHEVHLATPTVSKLLKILLEADLVKSYRGTGGGYQLAKPVNQITIADIVSAVEGRLAMTECCSVAKTCALDSLCAIKENWQVINNIILTALGGLTLADMTRPLQNHPLVLRGIPVKVVGIEEHGK